MFLLVQYHYKCDLSSTNTQFPISHRSVKPIRETVDDIKWPRRGKFMLRIPLFRLSNFTQIYLMQSILMSINCFYFTCVLFSTKYNVYLISSIVDKFGMELYWIRLNENSEIYMNRSWYDKTAIRSVSDHRLSIRKHRSVEHFCRSVQGLYTCIFFI